MKNSETESNEPISGNKKYNGGKRGPGRRISWLENIRTHTVFIEHYAELLGAVKGTEVRVKRNDNPLTDIMVHPKKKNNNNKNLYKPAERWPSSAEYFQTINEGIWSKVWRKKNYIWKKVY